MKNYVDIAASTELKQADEVSDDVNELSAERLSIQHLDATFSNTEDIGTKEISQEISIAFANISADGVDQTTYEPATSQETAENSEEQQNLEIVEEIVGEIDVESKGNLHK